jgi:hypothetical protein
VDRAVAPSEAATAMVALGWTDVRSGEIYRGHLVPTMGLKEAR